MFDSNCNATFLLGERRKVNDSSRGSTPPPERSNSPPIPTIRRSSDRLKLGHNSLSESIECNCVNSDFIEGEELENRSLSSIQEVKIDHPRNFDNLTQLKECFYKGAKKAIASPRGAKLPVRSQVVPKRLKSRCFVL